MTYIIINFNSKMNRLTFFSHVRLKWALTKTNLTLPVILPNGT